MKRMLPVVCLFLALGCVSQTGQIPFPYLKEVTEVYENNIQVQSISLDISTYNGYIEVHLWEKESYRIEVNKWARADSATEAFSTAKELKVEFSEKKRAESITLLLKASRKDNTGVKIKAFLPDTLFDSIHLSTLNGYILVEEITGSEVFLENTNGNVEGSITAREIVVNTSNGGINGRYQRANVLLETTNGKVEVELCESGEYTVKTTNGSIWLTVYSDFSFDLTVTNGEILVDADEVVYTVQEQDHQEGYTAQAPGIFLAASAVNGSVTVVREVS